MSLNERKRLFIAAYNGDLVTSMRTAGYSGPDKRLVAEGEKMLSDPAVAKGIKERSKIYAKTQRAIADREERQELLTSWMRNEDPHTKEERDEYGNVKPHIIAMQNRIKALELLGKSEGDFIDKVDLNVSMNLSEIIMSSYSGDKSGVDDDLDIDTIEAEYMASKGRQELIMDATYKEGDEGYVDPEKVKSDYLDRVRNTLDDPEFEMDSSEPTRPASLEALF